MEKKGTAKEQFCYRFSYGSKLLFVCRWQSFSEEVQVRSEEFSAWKSKVILPVPVFQSELRLNQLDMDNSQKLKAFLQSFTHCWAKKNSAAEEIHSAGWLLSGRVQPLSQMWSTTSFHTTRSLNSLHIFFVMPVKLCTKIAQSDKWLSFTVLQ